MAVFQPTQDVFQVTRFHSFSSHFMVANGEATLIDTGMPGSASAIGHTLESAEASPTRILITHAHMDHIGSLDAVCANNPSLVIVASERTARLMTGDLTLLPDEHQRPLKGGFRICKTKPTQFIRNGENVAGFRVVFTPGHTVGHVSYFHEATGYLFTGDVFHSAGGRLAVSGEFRFGFPFPYFTTWDREQALASAKKLRDLRPSTVFPAHGKAVIDPADALDKAIHYAEKAFN